MRSFREIRVRSVQELRNLLLFAFPPRVALKTPPPSPLPLLPDPERIVQSLAGTGFADELRANAREILKHRFPLLGQPLDTGAEIRWRKDYRNGPETGCGYFRLIPYLDRARAGDHKNIWELNRHQHLLLLAQLHRFDADPALLEEIWRELESWLEANPFQRGINWTSALEVAFRAFSWIWIYHLAGAAMPPALRTRFLESLHQHGRHIEVNLSFYFSPNTHLLGEAVVLHALGRLFPEFPRAARWRELGARVVREQLGRQVRGDGGHFEQSTYYHVYALDMFLLHGILEPAGEAYREKVAQMADYLAAVQGPARILPFLGDDDGGRFFHPFGPRNRFARATLATCAAWLEQQRWTYDTEDLYPQAAWWLGQTNGNADARPVSHLFAETGTAVMIAGDRHIVVDAGAFGPWGSGHSHSDTLSLVARRGDREILIDPGTYTYVGDAAARNWFRGSAAHNTVRIGGRDQADPVNPFRWENQPAVSVRQWISSEQEDFLDAQSVSRGILHRRKIRFLKPGLLLIVDEVRGAPAEQIEQFWHFASREEAHRMTLSESFGEVEAWQSSVFGYKQPGFAICARPCSTSLLAAALQLETETEPVTIEFRRDAVLFRIAGRSFQIAVGGENSIPSGE